jgi:hypothetical protein
MKDVAELVLDIIQYGAEQAWFKVVGASDNRYLAAKGAVVEQALTQVLLVNPDMVPLLHKLYERRESDVRNTRSLFFMAEVLLGIDSVILEDTQSFSSTRYGLRRRVNMDEPIFGAFDPRDYTTPQPWRWVQVH